MSMTNVIIRQALLQELPKLLEFEQGVIASERPFNTRIKDEKVSYYDIGELILAENAEVLVAEVGGKLVGSGYAKIMSSKSYLNHQNHSYVGFMYVDPDFRRKGIIKLIIDGLIHWSKSKGVFEMCLDVYHDNNKAVAAYEKYGFKKNLIGMRMNLEN